MRRQIENYRPYSVSASDWDNCAELVRNAVAAASPHSVDQAAKLLRLASRIALWSVNSSGHDLVNEAVFHPENIRRHMARASTGTASTRRRDTARLGILSHTLVGTPLPRSTNGGSPAVAAPYRPRDRAGLNSWAARQRQEWKRRDGQFILALGFGAGLEAMVDDYLLTQHSRGKSELMAGFHSTNNYGAPRRLRSTWIVTHLSYQSPLPEFLAAAGLNSTATLLRYLPFVTATEHAAEILAGAGS